MLLVTFTTIKLSILAIQATNGKDFTINLIDGKEMENTIEMHSEWTYTLKQIHTEDQVLYEQRSDFIKNITGPTSATAFDE